MEPSQQQPLVMSGGGPAEHRQEQQSHPYRQPPATGTGAGGKPTIVLPSTGPGTPEHSSFSPSTPAVPPSTSTSSSGAYPNRVAIASKGHTVLLFIYTPAPPVPLQPHGTGSHGTAPATGETSKDSTTIAQQTTTNAPPTVSRAPGSATPTMDDLFGPSPGSSSAAPPPAIHPSSAGGPRPLPVVERGETTGGGGTGSAASSSKNDRDFAFATSARGPTEIFVEPTPSSSTGAAPTTSTGRSTTGGSSTTCSSDAVAMAKCAAAFQGTPSPSVSSPASASAAGTGSSGRNSEGGGGVCYVFAVGASGNLIPVPISAITPSGAVALPSELASCPRGLNVGEISTAATDGSCCGPTLSSGSGGGGHQDEDDAIYWCPSLDSAKSHYGPFDRWDEYPTLFGALLLDKLYLLVATKVQFALQLPLSMGQIFTVLGSKWVSIALPSVPPIYFHRRDRAHLKQLQDFGLEVGYYFCDTCDLSTPFPHRPLDMYAKAGLKSQEGCCPCVGSSKISTGTNDSSSGSGPIPSSFGMDCDWSSYLREPFDALVTTYGVSGTGGSGGGGTMGVSLRFAPYCCSVLYRGFVEGGSVRARMAPKTNPPKAAGQQSQTHPTNPPHSPPSNSGSEVEVFVHLLGRQSHRNPGPRYYGRGLNEDAGAGNDHTYELVTWYTTEEPVEDASSEATPQAAAAAAGALGVGICACPSSDLFLEDASRFQSCSAVPSRQAQSQSQPRPSGGGRGARATRTVLHYARHTLLRGTVPVHWQNKGVKGLSEATMVFNPETKEVLKASGVYFSHLGDKLAALIRYDTAEEKMKAKAKGKKIPTPPLPPTATSPPASGTVDGDGSQEEEEEEEEGLPPRSVRCLNLLRLHPHHEHILTTHYANCIRYLTNELEFDRKLNLHTDFVHLDWLGQVKDNDLSGAVEQLWHAILPIYTATGAPTCTVGSLARTPTPLPAPRMRKDGGGKSSGNSPDSINPPYRYDSTVRQVQTDFYRINCADSLDRTNLGCFFTSLQLVLDMLLLLGVESVLPTHRYANPTAGTGMSPVQSADTSPSSGPAVPTTDNSHQPMRSPPTASASLPPPVTGTPSPSPDTYGNINDGGAIPVPVSPFFSPSSVATPLSPMRLRGDAPESPRGSSAATGGGMYHNRLRAPFYTTLREVKQLYPSPLLRLMCRMFIRNGDCIAELYTSSGALHTNAIRQLVPGMKTAPLNVYLSAKRRFENVFEDKKKFRALEIILGRRIPYHFPALNNSAYYALRLPMETWPKALVVEGLAFQEGDLCRWLTREEQQIAMDPTARSECAGGGGGGGGGGGRGKVADDALNSTTGSCGVDLSNPSCDDETYLRRRLLIAKAIARKIDHHITQVLAKQQGQEGEGGALPRGRQRPVFHVHIGEGVTGPESSLTGEDATYFSMVSSTSPVGGTSASPLEGLGSETEDDDDDQDDEEGEEETDEWNQQQNAVADLHQQGGAGAPVPVPVGSPGSPTPAVRYTDPEDVEAGDDELLTLSTQSFKAHRGRYVAVVVFEDSFDNDDRNTCTHPHNYGSHNHEDWVTTVLGSSNGLLVLSNETETELDPHQSSANQRTTGGTTDRNEGEAPLVCSLRPYHYPVQPPKVNRKQQVAKRVESAGRRMKSIGASLKKGFFAKIGKKKK